VLTCISRIFFFFFQAANVASVVREVNDRAESIEHALQILTNEEVKLPQFRASLVARGQIVLRNKRCALAYLHNRLTRLTDLWWSCGHALPEEVRVNLSPNELAAYDKYDDLLVQYMRQTGVAISNDQQPPKDSLIEVEAIEDCGEIMTEHGPVTLTKHSRHLMRRTECELLIRQGLVQQTHNSP